MEPDETENVPLFFISVGAESFQSLSRRRENFMSVRLITYWLCFHFLMLIDLPKIFRFRLRANCQIDLNVSHPGRYAIIKNIIFI